MCIMFAIISHTLHVMRPSPPQSLPPALLATDLYWPDYSLSEHILHLYHISFLAVNRRNQPQLPIWHRLESRSIYLNYQFKSTNQPVQLFSGKSPGPASRPISLVSSNQDMPRPWTVKNLPEPLCVLLWIGPIFSRRKASFKPPGSASTHLQWCGVIGCQNEPARP
jgi:hypothetical protein